jgi:hypothetical protein
MIQASDEQAHRPAEHPHAQESWYFNWSDPAHDCFGLARIGFRYNQRRIDPLVLTLRGGRPEFFYPIEALPPMRDSWDDLSVEVGLRGGRLQVAMEEPLKRWRVRLEGRGRMDLVFESITPPFDYHGEGREIASTMTTAHFEQTCTVRGWTEFRGERLEIDGLGQRDKSWGIRVWPEVEGWDWISAQFGQDLSFNAMRTFEKGRRFANGFVFREGRNHAIQQLEIDHRWGHQAHLPERVDLELVDEGGARHRISAQARGSFPIFKSGCWLEETQARFRYQGEGPAREGAGVIEHVWRPSLLQGLRRAPRMLAAGLRVLRR